VKGARESKPTTQYTEQDDAEVEANPPVIVWEKDRHGVLRHVEIYDPLADAPNRNPTKPRKKP
jgi:hypothetical protein